ncbi:hypothetical protein FH000_12690 [Listeria monocytogenes]|nr:hypothetical protein [Listeria monocytogenes]
MKGTYYKHEIELYAQYLTFQKDDLRYENGYLLTYELAWENVASCIDFNQETTFKRTNVVDLLPTELDFQLIRQIELVKIASHRLVINLYLKDIPLYLQKMWRNQEEMSIPVVRFE